ncbi:peptidase MA family metallohydrolase [Chloroflexota bacterium]
MRRKVGLLVLVAGLFLAMLSPVSAQTGDGLAVLDSSVEVDFPLRFDFNLSTQSDVNITDIRLNYVVDRISHAEVTSEVYIDFVPATTVETGWSWDMRKTGGLPPGSSIGYWWSIEDAGGDRIETEPVRVQFDDTRYSWQSLTEGMITLYWYQGSQSFAQEIMDTAQQALIRLAEDTGAEPEKPVNLYIYADAENLRGAMIFPQEWTGGVAFTRFGTIAIGIGTDELDWGRRAIAHELTHLVIHQMVFNPYNDLPTWLDEGLAMYTEGSLSPGFAGLLEEAITKDELISVRSLSSPFSAYAEESALSYAQSYSLVEFLIRNYGQSKMLALLTTFREGSGYDEALVKVYGFDMDGLDSSWRGYPLK